MEPSQNSADWYHFTTVHAWLAGVPFFLPLKVDHQIKCHYGSIKGEPSVLETDGERTTVPVLPAVVSAAGGATPAGGKGQGEGSLRQRPGASKTSNPAAAETAAVAGSSVRLHAKRPVGGDGEEEEDAVPPPPPALLARYTGTESAASAVEVPSHVILIDEAVLALRLWGWLKLPVSMNTGVISFTLELLL